MLRWAAVFFVIALACHGELARTRPPPARLTAFYLIVAAGGAAGGALVALVAPIVFPAVWEYPLALVAVCALRASCASSALKCFRPTVSPPRCERRRR